MRSGAWRERVLPPWLPRRPSSASSALPGSPARGGCTASTTTWSRPTPWCALDPYVGSLRVVCEAAQNLACLGAVPVAATDCLNFGNPERPEVFWTFRRAVEGISRACEALGIPVISGNVSFYNEEGGQAIFPTPTVAMLGLVEDTARHATPGWK